MYQLGIVVDGVFYEKSYQPMPAEVDESAIVGYVKSYVDAFPEENGETNISKDLLNAPYAKVEGGIALLYQNEWYLCKPRFIRSVLYYVPYCVLAAMSLPAMLYVAPNMITGIVATATAITTALFTKNLIAVASLSAISILIMELLIIPIL